MLGMCSKGRNMVTWKTMILGQVKCGCGHKALRLFQGLG